MGEVSRLWAPPVHPLLWGHPEQRVALTLLGFFVKFGTPYCMVQVAFHSHTHSMATPTRTTPKVWLPKNCAPPNV